jgi:hypothetical protein
MNSIFQVEQIQIPPELGAVMKAYTKAVIKEEPQDLYKWSANYFAQLCNQAPPFTSDGHLLNSRSNTQNGSLPHSAEGPLLTDVIPDCEQFESVATEQAQKQADAVLEAIFDKYDKDRSGRLERNEIPLLIKDLAPYIQSADVSEEEQVNTILSLLDFDQDGKISREEFKSIFMGQPL